MIHTRVSASDNISVRTGSANPVARVSAAMTKISISFAFEPMIVGTRRNLPSSARTGVSANIVTSIHASGASKPRLGFSTVRDKRKSSPGCIYGVLQSSTRDRLHAGKLSGIVY